MITQTNAVSRIKWYAKQIDETSELLPAAKTKAEREIHRSNLKNWVEAILLETLKLL